MLGVVAGGVQQLARRHRRVVGVDRREVGEDAGTVDALPPEEVVGELVRLLPVDLDREEAVEAAEAQQLSKAQRWEELPALIDDSVLHEFVTVGTYDEIGTKILRRYGDVVTDIEFSIAIAGDQDRDTLQHLARMLQEASDAPTRATITGEAAPAGD